MTVPIYVVAAILAVITAWFSDKVGKRSPFIIGYLFLMILGYGMYV
jgi:MFS family permease